VAAAAILQGGRGEAPRAQYAGTGYRMLVAALGKARYTIE